MDSGGVASCLKRGLEDQCADNIEEGLCNLRDGTSDAVELIPLLERVINSRFYFFDDNSSGGLPHPSGGPVGFVRDAREAIRNIRENAKLKAASPIARALKSLDADEVSKALEQLAESSSTDESLFPILEKIAKKDKYDSYAYIGGRSITHELGQAACAAIRRVRENRKTAGLPVRICPVCDSIHFVAHPPFGAALASLKRHALGKDDDLWECVECGALFHWRAERPQYGDPETLSRFLTIHAEVLRQIFGAGGRADDLAGLAERLLALPRAAWMFAGLLLRRDRALFRQLVPALIEAAIGDDEGAGHLLWHFSSTPEDARFLLAALEASTSPATHLEWLRTHARVVSCSICSSLVAEPAPKLRRNSLPENLSKLRQLGASERNDAWDCPECASVFHWTSEDGIDGGLARITYPLAGPLRSFMHRTDLLDEDTVKTIFESGPEWEQFLYEYGLRRDPQLVTRLVPYLVMRLAQRPRPWLLETLREIARDPNGADAVRFALPRKISRQNKEIQSLARRLRQPKARK
jgi:uncharacterized protein with PIN domain